MNIIAFEVRSDEIKTFLALEKQHGIKITYISEILSKDNVSLTKGYEAVTIIGFSKIDPELIDLLKENGVNYISTRSIGFNHIDVEYAKQQGIQISNAYYAPNGVADFTIMLMLMALRNYKQALFRGNVNDYSLIGLQGKEMRNMTVGIIGTGNIGSAVMKNLQGFGCRIVAYSAKKQTNAEQLCTYVSLDELYEMSDIISLHVPLTEETYHMINNESLSKMKDGVILINTARGSLMSMKSLIHGIEQRKIGALGLDVIEDEEGLYHKDLRTDIISNRDIAYLRQFPNVIMTQHMAFYTKDAVESMVSCGVNNLIACLSNEQCDLLL